MARWHIDLQQRWGDQDAYGHVNNVMHARYFEEARVRTFFTDGTREQIGLAGLFRTDTPDGMKMVVASQTIEFLRVLEYSTVPMVVEMWIGKLGGSSLELYAQLSTNDPERTVVTRCKTVAVVVDGTNFAPAKLTEEARSAASKWMDEPFAARR